VGHDPLSLAAARCRALLTPAQRAFKVMTPMAKTNSTADALDPAGQARGAVKLRTIHDLAENIAANEQRLRDAVVNARAAGYGLGKISASLDVTARAARSGSPASAERVPSRSADIPTSCLPVADPLVAGPGFEPDAPKGDGFTARSHRVRAAASVRLDSDHPFGSA
jgi:hypothetical protein